MNKILLTLIALILLAAPVLGICGNWTSGLGTEADNFIKSIATKFSIPEEAIDDNFSYYVVIYAGSRTAILKVTDLNYGDEVYHKSINDLPRKNNSRRDHSSSQSDYNRYSDGSDSFVDDQNKEFKEFKARIDSDYSYGYGLSYSDDDRNKEFEEFKDRIDSAVKSKNPAEIMNVANEMTDDYWWENYKIKSPGRHAIELTVIFFLIDIRDIPDMYDIYTMLITNLTQRDLETSIGLDSDTFVGYVKNDKNVNVSRAIQFLESTEAKIPDINFDNELSRDISKNAFANSIKELKNFKR